VGTFDDATSRERGVAFAVPTLCAAVAVRAQPSTASRWDPLFIGGILLAAAALELLPSVLIVGLVRCRAILWASVVALVALSIATAITIEREHHSTAGLVYLGIPYYGTLLAVAAGLTDRAFHRFARRTT
jgi:hypothetical protein